MTHSPKLLCRQHFSDNDISIFLVYLVKTLESSFLLIAQAISNTPQIMLVLPLKYSQNLTTFHHLHVTTLVPATIISPLDHYKHPLNHSPCFYSFFSSFKKCRLKPGDWFFCLKPSSDGASHLG